MRDSKIDGPEPTDSGGSDTVRSDNGDTVSLLFSPNQRVRIAAGAMEGWEGTVSGNRSNGLILLRLLDGVFVEIHQYVLEEIA
jgi:hypothetical protein